jgi:hypothetical protein
MITGENNLADVPAGMLHVDKDLPRLDAFFHHVVQGDPGLAEEVLRVSRLYEGGFLAWQTIRKGNRAGLLVGDISCRGQTLPYTGFEGYYADLNLGPADVVKDEARHGCHILEELHHYCVTAGATQHTPGAALAALLATMRGQSYEASALTLLNKHFGALLGRLRAQETMQAGWYDSFKGTTYDSIATALLYTRPQGVLHEHYTVPLWADRASLPPASVVLDEQEMAGYELMAEIGRMGHPLVRSLLHGAL